MEFITIPLVVGMITYGIYGLFELFVRRKERIMLIEKIGEKIDPPLLQIGKLKFPSFVSDKMTFSFSVLKWGFLLLGVGFGLLVGICFHVLIINTFSDFPRYIVDMTCGACVLMFGGLGLILSFVIEKKITREEVRKAKKKLEQE